MYIIYVTYVVSSKSNVINQLHRKASILCRIILLITFPNACSPFSLYYMMPSLIVRTAVKSIKKQHLVEVRSMANPPAIVKVALESICLLLGENASDWKSIRAVIMRDNFINTIVSNFSTEDIT